MPLRPCSTCRHSFQRQPTRRSSVEHRHGLGYDILECRTMLSTLRIGAWNTFNRPNNTAHEQAFSTVFTAIEDTLVQGNAQPLDLLAVAETDTGSAVELENIFDELYDTTAFEVITSSSDSGGDRTGFVYNTDTLMLLESVELPDIALTHTLLRAKFRPTAGLLSDEFYVYSVHLKAGGGSANEGIRGAEAALIRADADALGADARIIYAGDFNLSDSNEAAWASITGPGFGAASDVADAPGDWEDNPAFKQLHTQSVTVVDSRFDFIFASDELRDGVGIDYVEDSFTILGNNGTHNLNGSIATGTGASPEVLAALLEASDHLPIFSDFQLQPTISQVIVPDAFSLVRGKVAAGGLKEIQFSDNQSLAARSGKAVSAADANLTIEVQGTSPLITPDRLTFQLETRVNTPNVGQTVQLFNYTTSEYVTVDTRPTTLSDSAIEIMVELGAEDFVESGTGDVQARISWDPTGLVLFFPWTVSVDQAAWTVEGVASLSGNDVTELPDVVRVPGAGIHPTSHVGVTQAVGDRVRNVRQSVLTAAQSIRFEPIVDDIARQNAGDPRRWYRLDSIFGDDRFEAEILEHDRDVLSLI